MQNHNSTSQSFVKPFDINVTYSFETMYRLPREIEYNSNIFIPSNAFSDLWLSDINKYAEDILYVIVQRVHDHEPSLQPHFLASQVDILECNDVLFECHFMNYKLSCSAQTARNVNNTKDLIVHSIEVDNV